MGPYLTSEKIQRFRPIGTAERIVYAIAPAGAGAAVWHPMATAVNASIDMRAIRLPGREERFGEKPIRSVDIQVADILPALRAQIEHENIPYHLVGMCAGAILAFELTSALEATSGLRKPASLIVINQEPPTESALRRLRDAADETSNADWLSDVAGLPPEMITDEVLEFFGPTIEADLAATSSYRYNANIINTNVVVVVGGTRADLPLNGENSWTAFTNGNCELVRMTRLQPEIDTELAALISKVAV